MPNYITGVEFYPSRLIEGDAVDITISLSDYPAPEYTITYYAIRQSDRIIWTAQQVGTNHRLYLLSSVTATYDPGLYSVQVYATNTSGQRTTLYEGTLTIVRNYGAASPGGFDTRTYAQIILDAIEAVIQNRATLDQESYTIAGRSLARTPIEDLLKLRDRFRAEVKAEQKAEDIRAGKNAAGLVKTEFVNY